MGVQDRTSPCTSRSLRSDGYYLECRKDAQCECSMCKASITATLDLRNPLRPPLKENQPWPPPFPSCFSPIQSSSVAKRRQNRNLPARSLQHRRYCAKGRIFWPFLVLLPSLIVLCALPWILSCFSQAYFSNESFTQLAQASLVHIRLFDRLDFIQQRISRITRAPTVSNCTAYEESFWSIAENGHLLHSKCLIYGSALEKIAVWGTASMTGGILGRSLVDRSFVVLSGRVLEWEEGHIRSIEHQEGSTWKMHRWSASAVLLDRDTWILEYKRTPFSTHVGIFDSLKHVILSAAGKCLCNIKLSFDTALFVNLHSLDVFSHYQAFTFGNELRPT